MNSIENINLDCFEIITSFLKVEEYKHINKQFNLKARQIASKLIFNQIKKLHTQRIYIEDRIDNIVSEYFLYRNLDNIIQNNGLDILLSYYKQCIPITKRSVNNCDILIKEQSDYVYEYIKEYNNISCIRVEYDMSEVYENNLEMIELQMKLSNLKLTFKKECYEYKDNLEYIFCDKIINENLSIESAVFYIENILYINVVDFLASKKIRLNHFCDEYIVFSCMKDLLVEIKQAYKDRLNSIRDKKDFNNLINCIEPEVLIDNIHKFQ